MTTNAKLFNPPGSIYYIEADRIEVWALDHIAKAAGTVIQYETDWNIEIEKEDEDEVNVDENENEEDGMDIDDRRARSVSVLSQQQQAQAGPSSRRGPRGLYKRQGQGPAGAGISESLEQDGGLPGSKDGLGAFPPGSDWAKTVLALKLKSTTLFFIHPSNFFFLLRPFIGLICLIMISYLTLCAFSCRKTI